MTNGLWVIIIVLVVLLLVVFAFIALLGRFLTSAPGSDGPWVVLLFALPICVGLLVVAGLAVSKHFGVYQALAEKSPQALFSEKHRLDLLRHMERMGDSESGVLSELGESGSNPHQLPAEVQRVGAAERVEQITAPSSPEGGDAR